MCLPLRARKRLDLGLPVAARVTLGLRLLKTSPFDVGRLQPQLTRSTSTHIHTHAIALTRTRTHTRNHTCTCMPTQVHTSMASSMLVISSSSSTVSSAIIFRTSASRPPHTATATTSTRTSTRAGGSARQRVSVIIKCSPAMCCHAPAAAQLLRLLAGAANGTAIKAQRQSKAQRLTRTDRYASKSLRCRALAP